MTVTIGEVELYLSYLEDVREVLIHFFEQTVEIPEEVSFVSLDAEHNVYNIIAVRQDLAEEYVIDKSFDDYDYKFDILIYDLENKLGEVSINSMEQFIKEIKKEFQINKDKYDKEFSLLD